MSAQQHPIQCGEDWSCFCWFAADVLLSLQGECRRVGSSEPSLFRCSQPLSLSICNLFMIIFHGERNILKHILSWFKKTNYIHSFFKSSTDLMQYHHWPQGAQTWLINKPCMAPSAAAVFSCRACVGVILTWAAGLWLVSGTDCGTAPPSGSPDSGHAGRSCPCAYRPREEGWKEKRSTTGHLTF